MEIVLKIKNFKSISKRKDIQKPTWFALDNDLFSHPDFFEIDARHFMVFVWVISVASKCNSDEIRINTRLCAHQLCIDESEVVASIEKLNEKRWTCDLRHIGERGRSVARDVQTDRQTNIQTNKDAKKIFASPEKEKGVNDLIATYCDNWKERYQSNQSPPITGKNAGQMKTLMKDFGFEKSSQIVCAYLSMPDQWFLKKRHDIPTMLSSLNAITHFIETGTMITNSDIKRIEKAVDAQNVVSGLFDDVPQIEQRNFNDTE